MGSSSDTVRYIMDQAGLGSRLSSRKMFGEFALYLDGKVVALVCDDQLFLKPTAEGRSCLGEVKESPPYPGAKGYYLLAGEIDEPERLRQAILVTAKSLPEPKPKITKPAKRSARGNQVSARAGAPVRVAGKTRGS